MNLTRHFGIRNSGDLGSPRVSLRVRSLWCWGTLIAVLASCHNAPPTAVTKPTFADAAKELSNLQGPITVAIRARNVSSIHDELHQAMYLADHLPEMAATAGASPAQRETLTQVAKQLFDQLMVAHEGFDGNGEESPDAMAEKITQCVTEIAGIDRDVRLETRSK